MTAQKGILACGAYIPRKRLQRRTIYEANCWFAPGLKRLGQGERAIANWDEDTITMAVAAARDTVAAIDRSAVGCITLASTTLPFADRLNAGIVKEALNLPDAVGALDTTGSQRAATTSLMRALAAVQSDDRAELLIASEMRPSRPASEGELLNGDGAAGLLVGSGPVLARLLGSHSVTIDFVDHFRSTTAEFDYGWESRWIRDEGYMKMIGDALVEAATTLDFAPGDIDHFVVPVTATGVAEGLARRAGIRAEAIADRLGAQVGETGAAHPFLMLTAAMERAVAGDKILVVGFGQGVDMLLFERTERPLNQVDRHGVGGNLSRRTEDTNYLRWLFHREQLKLDRGMRAEADEKQPGTTLWRNRKAVLGLVGGRCTKTGTVQFPKSDIGVNPNDRAVGTQEDYPLADVPARIVTYTADSLTYSASPPAFYGMIDFDGGGRLMAEFADVDDEAMIEVGREVRMVFRIKAVDERRDFTRYFWKAAPID